jgi:glycosyltransferase involved in cell wall biosynthesis
MNPRARVTASERQSDSHCRDCIAWFDVTDIFDFITSNSSVTGIQRVVAQLLTQLAPSDLGSLSAAENVVPIGVGKRIGSIVLCQYDLDRHEYVVIPHDRFAATLKEFMAPSRKPKSLPRRAGWARLRKTAISLIPKPIRPNRFRTNPTAAAAGHGSDACRFQSGDVFVLPGSFWFRPFHVNVILSVCHAYKMQLAVLVHDLIPMRCPTWFSARYVAAWSSAIGLVLRSADVVLTPSSYSAEDIRTFYREAGIAEPKIAMLRYGETTSRLAAFESAPARAERVGRYVGPGYVLMVSSIDRRKNQQLLIKVWQRLHAKYGAATPYLVLIGKPAADADSILQSLRDCGFVQRHIVLLGDVDDTELAAFYDGALFTVFPSRAEGWGLPVSESLFHGKVCIAANSWSIPEVAGDLVEYFDPDDVDGCYALVERYCFDHDARRAREQRICTGYLPTDWAETARALIGVLDQLVADANGPSNAEATLGGGANHLPQARRSGTDRPDR